MRYNDAETWCDVGQYRACIARKGALLEFTVHAKPDLSEGYARAVVLTRGWIADDAVKYAPPSQPLAPDLERDLLVASRRMRLHVTTTNGDD